MLVYQRVILNNLLLKEYLRSPAKNLYEFVMFCRVSKIPRSPDQQPEPPWVLWALTFGHFWNSKKRTEFPGWYRWCFSQSFQVCNFFSVYFGVAINIMLIYCTCLKLVWWNQSQPKIKFSREHDDESWNDYLCSPILWRFATQTPKSSKVNSSEFLPDSIQLGMDTNLPWRNEHPAAEQLFCKAAYKGPDFGPCPDHYWSLCTQIV